jgi:hypothetical protein
MAASWAYVGVLCYVNAVQKDDTVPLYRYWDGNHHFYITSQADYDSLPANYRKDGVICFISTIEKRGLSPLYLLVDPNDGNQSLWITEEDKDYLIEDGHELKGILGYVGRTDSYGKVPFYYSENPELNDSFYTANVIEIDEMSPSLDENGLFDVLKEQIDDYFVEKPKVCFSDIKYFCPTFEATEDIIEDAMIDQYEYISGLFDCDDYAHLLKSAFIIDGYDGGIRSLPYCIGIAWGEKKPNRHAINIIIISDGIEYKVQFIDPQTGDITDPDKNIIDKIELLVF